MNHPTRIISLLQCSKGVIKDRKRKPAAPKTIKIQKLSPLSITITPKEFTQKPVLSNNSKKSYSIQKIELIVSEEPSPSLSSPIKSSQVSSSTVKHKDSCYRPNSAGHKLLLKISKLNQSLKRRRLSEDDTFFIAGSSFRNNGERGELGIGRRKSFYN